MMNIEESSLRPSTDIDDEDTNIKSQRRIQFCVLWMIDNFIESYMKEKASCIDTCVNRRPGDPETGALGQLTLQRSVRQRPVFFISFLFFCFSSYKAKRAFKSALGGNVWVSSLTQSVTNFPSHFSRPLFLPSSDT